MINEDKIYEDAIGTWGSGLQLDMMIEECAELIQAITRVRRGGDTEQLIEELADVIIMTRQMEKMFGHGRVGLAVQGKLERLQRRLEEHPAWRGTK